MQQGRASQTAAWVATARSLGRLLPSQLVLAQDPYGVRFASRRLRALASALERSPELARMLLPRLGPLADLVMWMQLRTRALDDLMLSYLVQRGRQIVLLGAGFDCRALRFSHALQDAKVYEVDYPATQQEKRRLLGSHASPQARYLAWDFERDPLHALPTRLAALGLNVSAPTLTLWEGVTMYLSESAIDESVRAVHGLGAAGSCLAFNYIDQRALAAPGLGLKAVTHVVKRAGEPYQFGWAPEALLGWLDRRNFTLESDRSEHDLAAQYWPLQKPRANANAGRRIAIARTHAP